MMANERARFVRGGRIFLGLVCLALFLPGAAVAQDDGRSNTVESQLLEQLGEARIYRNDATDKVSLIGATSKRDTIARPAGLAANASPVAAARAHFSKYGQLFGLRTQANELRSKGVDEVGRGRSVVHFQQVHGGVPVFGGELNVQLTDTNELLVANGEVLPGVSLDTKPDVSAAEARETALTRIARDRQVDAADLSATEPELWIYDPTLLGAPGPQLTSLVWRLDVTPRGPDDFRELVLVDAESGNVALNFDQVENARDRRTHTANNSSTLPGALVCDESNPSCAGTSDTDAQAAHRYAGDTYGFYVSNHGRDSLDNAGMTLISTVHYCPGTLSCPYRNAFWNGQQMVYGNGFSAADDVVGHELTHGVTSYESNLFYYYQSGAINESFSDVWGEFVDLTNGAGTDTDAVRWKLGEDVPGIGAIRDMKTPSLFNDPDRMQSSLYAGGQADAGGVHTNSGVNNKAAYLMTDGGTFNGKTVSPLGIPKVARIYYEAQTNLLTSASDYNDLYGVLQQACTNLVGTSSITTGDCQEVKDAVDATEMNLQPTTPGAAPAPDAPVCPTQQPNTLFSDDMENPASGNWTSQAIIGSNQWYYPQPANRTYATSGNTNLWGNDQASTGDSYIARTGDVTPPAGTNTYLRFNHAYGFDDDPTNGYDGGVLEYSTDHSSTWFDAGSLITDNGYNGTISAAESNPLGGRKGFVRESNGYTSTRVNLNPLAGQDVRFRFRIGTGQAFGDYGWFIDDVRVYTCDGPDTTPPRAPTITSPGNNSYDNDRTVTLSGTAEVNSTVDVFQDATSKKTTQAGPGGVWSVTLDAVPDGSHTYTARARDAAGNVSTTSNALTVIVDTVPPKVSNVSPADQRQKVALATNVQATFAEAMNSSTITNSTFTLARHDAGGSTTAVAAAVNYDPTSKKATLDPSSDLDPNSTYTATIMSGSNGAKDMAGNALQQNYSWTFTTTAPSVLSYTPTLTTGVPRNTSPTATFSTRMDPSTITATNIKFQVFNAKMSKWVNVAHTVGYDATSKKATVTPDSTLAASRKYRVTVTTNVKSSTGVALDQNPTTSGNQPKSWTFTTGTLTSYSAVGDFSATQNPSGVWSYGYRAAAGSNFVLYTSHANPWGANFDQWSLNNSPTVTPHVTYNRTGQTASYSSITQPPDLLNLHPGPSGERSVVRWTAPTSRTVKIEGRFEGIDTVGTTTNVVVVHNSATSSTRLFRGNITGYGASAPFSTTRSIAAGDTIEFFVGYGSNANNGFDSTGLQVSITY